MNSPLQQAYALYRSGRLREAHQAFAHACNRDPANAECRMMLGVLSAQLGALPLAIEHLQQATRLQPEYAPAWSNLGLALLKTNDLHNAEKCLAKAAELAPADAGTRNTLGTVYRQLGRIDDAIREYRQAIRIQPRNPHAHCNLGGILQEQCRTDEAISAYRKALKIDPRFAQAEFNLGSALQADGQHEQAIYHYHKALRLNPGFTEAAAAIAAIHEQDGNIEEAKSAIAPLLKGHATHTNAALTYASIARHCDEKGQAITLLRAVAGRHDLSPIERQQIEYALGDLLDSQGDYDNAFEHYLKANRIRPFPYSHESTEQEMKWVAERFTHDMPGDDERNDDTAGIILIVGMPRSSTSLVEQILASHPDVHGAGELPYSGVILSEIGREKGKYYPELIRHLDDTDIESFGRQYAKKLRAHSPESRFITDKMPHNFLHLGLFARAIPGIRLVHCMRNPLDTCLSIFFHNFNANHPYASDLANLGRYYRSYERLMDHWRETLGDKLLDIRYEDLLSNQESTTRGLLDYCGLPWNDNCLEFHKTRRAVSTPSYDQVRRPIYTSSKERWKNYEKHLSPLIDALGLG